MHELVSSGSQCTAIMLASTCKQERLRYRSLGYKWPFAGAHLSAARNGYYELFKWLVSECLPDRRTDFEYMRYTWHSVCRTPNIELFKWYAGPGYYFDADDQHHYSWAVFSGLFAQDMSREKFARVLKSSFKKKWGLKPFYYAQERFGSNFLDFFDHHLASALEYEGTLQDIYGLKLDVLFDSSEGTYTIKNRFSVSLLINSLSGGNFELLDALVKQWPVVMTKALIYLEFLNYNGELASSDFFSAAFIQRCDEQMLFKNFPIVLSKFIQFLAKRQGSSKVPMDVRSLLEYAKCILPDTIETIQQCADFMASRAKILTRPVPDATILYSL